MASMSDRAPSNEGLAGRHVFESRREEVERVQRLLLDTLSKHDFNEASCFAIRLALEEALANAYKHGNKEDPSKRVEVDCGVEQGVVVIRVRDQGKGFDPERVADPLATTNLMKPNGRGIFFMKNYMDEIDYTFAADGGTVVTLRKRLSSSPAEFDHREGK